MQTGNLTDGKTVSVRPLFASANGGFNIANGTNAFSRGRNDVVVKDMFIHYNFEATGCSTVTSGTGYPPLQVSANLWNTRRGIIKIFWVQTLIAGTPPTYADLFQENFATNEGAPAADYTYSQPGGMVPWQAFRRQQTLPVYKIINSKTIKLFDARQDLQVSMPLLGSSYYLTQQFAGRSAETFMKLNKPVVVKYKTAAGAGSSTNVVAGQIYEMIVFMNDYAAGAGATGTVTKFIGTGTTAGEHSDCGVTTNQRCRFYA